MRRVNLVKVQAGLTTAFKLWFLDLCYAIIILTCLFCKGDSLPYTIDAAPGTIPSYSGPIKNLC